MRRTQIILIDSNCRRRAKVSFELTNLMSYVLPLEDVTELAEMWPEEAVVLVEDRADNVARLSRMLQREGRALPFIAFAAEPEAARRTDAMVRGACAYLAWPAPVAEIGEAVSAARAGLLTREEPRRSDVRAVASNGMIDADDTRGDYLIRAHQPAPARPEADNVVALHALRTD